jgi:hypothetical protein
MNINEEKAENTPAGGVLVGKKDGQTIIHDKGTMSGYLVGKLHKDGGIKAVNKATGQPLEMQGGEVVITAPAVSDQTKREFEGKMMTNREILSAINEKGGGVSFANGGDIPAKIHTTDCEYKFGGKVVKDTDIAHSLGMNSTLKKGKQQFSSGDTTYDVDAIYNAIKKGKLRLKTKEVETFPMKYPVYDKNYAENHKIDFRKPNGITVLTESGEEVLIDGNHRMNNAYSKGRKTMKTYYVEDPKQISKFSKKNKFELGGENKMGGHLSKGKSLKQIAEMHNVSLAHINEELAKGLEVEKEHFADFKERTRVAKDHLVENPNYYTILEKAGLKMGGHIQRQELVEKSKKGDTPARDLNNYNDVLDVQADEVVGGDSGLAFADGGITPIDANIEGDSVDILANGSALGLDPKKLQQANTLLSNLGMKPINKFGKNEDEVGMVYILRTNEPYQTVITPDGVTVEILVLNPNPTIIKSQLVQQTFIKNWNGKDWFMSTIKDKKGINTNVYSGKMLNDLEFKLDESTPEYLLFSDTLNVTEASFRNQIVVANAKIKEIIKNGLNLKNESITVNYNSLLGVTSNPNKTTANKVPKIEKVTIKETRFNRASVVGRNASNAKELQDIIIDYVRNSSEEIDWIKFYVNDATRGSYYIDLNKGKKNTVKNVNTETVNVQNIKRVIDAKDYLVKNYDWTDFFELGSQTPISTNKSTSTSIQSQYPEYYEFIGNESTSFSKGKIYKIINPKDINDERNFIDNSGTPNGFSYKNKEKFKPSTEEAFLAQQSGGSSNSAQTLSSSNNQSSLEPKIVDAVNVEFVYPNGRIEMSATINISNLKNALANFWNIVDKKSWEVLITPFENQFTPFAVKELIIGSDFAEFNPETFSEEQLGNKLKSLYPDLDWSYFLKEKTTTSTNALNSAQKFDFTDTKIDVEDNPDLSLRVQKKAFEEGWEWENGGGKTLDYDDFNYLYFTKTSVSYGNITSSFLKSPKRKITEEEIFGSQATASQKPTSSQAPANDKEVFEISVGYINDITGNSGAKRKYSIKELYDFLKLLEYDDKFSSVSILPYGKNFQDADLTYISIYDNFWKKVLEDLSEDDAKDAISKFLITSYPYLSFNDYSGLTKMSSNVINQTDKEKVKYLQAVNGSSKHLAYNITELKYFIERLSAENIDSLSNRGSTMRVSTYINEDKFIAPYVISVGQNVSCETCYDILTDGTKRIKDILLSYSNADNYDWSDFFEETTTPISVVPKTVENNVYNLDLAVQKLEKASSTVVTEYNKDIYDKSLKFLYDTKATYELALKFTPESAFMYERLDILKKLADIEKNIKKIEDMKKGGTFYMLAKILEKLERGENWKQSESAEDVITNHIPKSEIEIIIRSQKFKNWFGDWEKALINDEYDNVSKALTDGIPSVYHHGARRIKYTYREVSNGVLYLAENISYALWFSQNSTAQSEEGNYLTECFVNIKNPIDLTAFNVNEIDFGDLIRYIDAIYPMANIYDFVGTQVALLVKSNQPTNIIMRAWQLIRKYAKFVKHVKENTPYDGFLYYENNPDDKVINPTTGQLEQNVTKAVAIFKSHQVKVVDAVLFDGGLDDWRFENGGKIKN